VGGILLVMGLVGCQSSDTPLSSQQTATSGGDAEPALESKALLDPVTTMPILRGALIQPHVVSARAMLEAEGYRYVESNSLVLIHQTEDDVPASFDAASRGPRPPRNPSRVGRVRTDTISWLAFENPTHDMANHTAVLHLSDGHRSGTVLVELDISGEQPSVLRQGYMSDTGLVSQDIGTEGWFACMAGGLVGSAVRCSLTNCAFGHCMGIGAAVSLAACTASALWSWLSH
jgi:hypothetical protein